jgi:hypothetical protein
VVKVVRKAAEETKTFEVNMVEILEKWKIEQDIELQSDDLVIVPKRTIN